MAHSGTYENPIVLGFEIKDAIIESIEEKANGEMHARKLKGKIKAKYSFTCSRKTQQIYLKQAVLNIDNVEFTVERKGSSHVYSLNKGDEHLGNTRLTNAFLFTQNNFGFSQESFVKTFPLYTAQRVISKELSNTKYLGPFRQPPQRQYPTRGATPIEVGSLGESTVTMLANEHTRSNARPAVTKVNEWLEHMGLAKTVSVSRLGSSDQFSTSFTLNDNTTLSISDLGYGMSQVLPVLTQCAFAQKNSTILFEQPEIHLHNLVAKKLASVFLDTVRDTGSNVIIETHSDALVNGLQQAMRSRELDPNDIVLYKVERVNSKSVITKVTFDEYFDVDLDWRIGCSQPRSGDLT